METSPAGTKERFCRPSWGFVHFCDDDPSTEVLGYFQMPTTSDTVADYFAAAPKSPSKSATSSAVSV